MAEQSIPPPRQTLMEAAVDNHGGLFGGRTVVLCGYSVGINYGDDRHGYDEDQRDEAEERGESKMVLNDPRTKKVENRGVTKRGSYGGKHELAF